MDWLVDPQVWIAFVTLVALEIVLGVDNIVFISILAGKLPAGQQKRARNIGLGLALVMRVILLFSLSWVVALTAPLFTFLGQEISGRDLILLLGGLFLLAKATFEIHENLEGEEGRASAKVAPTFTGVIVQILLLDAVFSLDSVITAIGMVDQVEIMIAAVIVAIVFMMVFAGTVAHFVQRHPTVKMLALSFLLLIGLTLLVGATSLGCLTSTARDSSRGCARSPRIVHSSAGLLPAPTVRWPQSCQRPYPVTRKHEFC
jgi:predicted tellurium resistance membrane protein TerC